MEDQARLVRKHFNASAEAWNEIYSAYDVPSLNIQRRLMYVLSYVDGLSLPHGAKVFDLGCGAGLTSVQLLKRGLTVVAADVSEEMVALAKSNINRFEPDRDISLMQTSAEDLSVKDQSFDLIVAMGLIEYLRRDNWALQEMHRALKPDGYLIVTVPNKRRLTSFLDPHYWARMLLDRVKGIKTPVGQVKIAGETFERRFYVPCEFKSALNNRGFKVVAAVSHGYSPFWLIGRSDFLSRKLDAVLQCISEGKRISFVTDAGANFIVLCKKEDAVKGEGR